MTVKNKVYILLDRSGSMQGMWSDAIGGINAYVNKLEDRAIEVSVAVFDTQSYDVIRNTTVENWKQISADEVLPRGGTPLLDATGRTIWNMIDSKADKSMLVIVTDGYENASAKFRAEEVKAMLKDIEKSDDKDIVFLGANFDGIADVAKSTLGWNDGSRVMATSARGLGAALNSTADATRAYFTAGATKAATFYSDEDRIKAKK